MSQTTQPHAALVLFSGGQDSTTCLAWALARFASVETIGFDYGQRDPIRRERVAEHLRPRPQPLVLHLRRGHRLSPRVEAPGRRHVRDRLFGLSRLPRRYVEGVAGHPRARDGPSLRDPHPADVARQGGDLGARPRFGWRAARRADPRGDAQLLPGRPEPAPRLGLWLRRLPGLRSAPQGLGGVYRRLTGVASFETRPPGAPQDDVVFDWN